MSTSGFVNTILRTRNFIIRSVVTSTSKTRYLQTLVNMGTEHDSNGIAHHYLGLPSQEKSLLLFLGFLFLLLFFGNFSLLFLRSFVFNERPFCNSSGTFGRFSSIFVRAISREWL